MPRTRPCILIVEDTEEIAAYIACELEVEGYEVHVEHDGMRGLVAARKLAPDLIILDRQLPGLDGLAFCRRYRESADTPILMLTAMGDRHERVEGLRSGATDYLPKPFDMEELIERVRAQLRLAAPPARTRLALDDLVLDTASREVFRGETPVALTLKEFELLQYMLTHARQVLTRAQILDAVWGYDFNGQDNVLEVTVSHLRSKIEPQGAPRLLHTVRGVGYVMRQAGTSSRLSTLAGTPPTSV